MNRYSVLSVVYELALSAQGYIQTGIQCSALYTNWYSVLRVIYKLVFSAQGYIQTGIQCSGLYTNWYLVLRVIYELVFSALGFIYTDYTQCSLWNKANGKLEVLARFSKRLLVHSWSRYSSAGIVVTIPISCKGNNRIWLTVNFYEKQLCELDAHWGGVVFPLAYKKEKLWYIRRNSWKVHIWLWHLNETSSLDVVIGNCLFVYS